MSNITPSLAAIGTPDTLGRLMVGNFNSHFIQFDAIAGTNFTNKEVYFNLGLFRKIGVPAFVPTRSNATGFYVDLNGQAPTGIGGPSFVMTWLMSDAGVNYSAFLLWISATQIQIYGNFFDLIDRADFANTSNDSITNNNVIYKAHINDASQLSPSVQSVYNNAPGMRRIESYVFTKDSTSPTLDDSAIGIYPNTDQAYHWNRGKGVATQELFLKSISLFKADGVTPITSLDTTAYTVVKAKIGPIINVGSPALIAQAWLLRTDDGNAITSNWQDQTQGVAFIPVAVGPGTLDRAIIGPASKTVTPAGPTDDNDIEFRINNTYLSIGAKYRIAIIAYNTDPTENRASLLSNEFNAGASNPSAIYPDYVSDTIQDYHASYGGSVISCVQARLRSTVTFDRVSYETKIAAAGISGTYNSLLKRLYFQIVDASNNFVLLQTSDFNPLIVRTDVGNNTTYKFEYRLEHGSIPGSWGGRNLIARLVQVFRYNTIIGGVPDTHTDNINFDQFIVCRNYENTAVSPKITDMELTDGANVIASQCPLTTATIRVIASDAAPSKQIAFIDAKIFSQVNLEEEDPLPSAQAFTQLDSAKLASATDTYTAGIATFDVVVGMLTKNKQYRVSAERIII